MDPETQYSTTDEELPAEILALFAPKEFILCERHSGPLVKLKDADYGTWKKRGRRPGFKKVDIADLENP